MDVGACVGLKETLAANRPGATGTDHYPLNEFVGQNFFDGENYRAALERLDGGRLSFHRPRPLLYCLS